MEEEKVNYIFTYLGNLMTKEESIAWKHYLSTFKLDNGEYLDPDSKETRRDTYLKKGWITEDAAILKLLEDGIEEFKNRTAKRIVNDSEESIRFNVCPNCERLARTPEAKQCRFCGQKWHLKNYR